MKFSENWLRTLVDPPADRATLAERLTMAGLEVEAITVLGSGLSGVVVAEIVSCDKHPNAEKLRVCQVDRGNGEFAQVVCGAPNARVGLKAPLATIGTKLPGGMEIGQAALRGVDSFGMLCSAEELALGEDGGGLLELPADAPVGQALEEYLALPDATIELKLTPNRPDCLGLRGLAFEIAALFGVAPTQATIDAVAPNSTMQREVRLAAPADCPRYLCRTIEGMDADAATPSWMAERLRRSGMRPISAVVDCTNYVMLELGQPTHAFDHDAIEGAIVVRRARAGEKLQLLDGREVDTDPEFLLIADERKPLALAGVMGGHGSRVTPQTRNLLLEAAHFAPPAIVGRARKLGMHTEASHRFERGVDPELPRVAIERLTGLLLEIVGGKAGPVIEAVSRENLPSRPAVHLREARIARVLGMTLEPERVATILHGLGMRIEREADGWRVTAPSRRFDIAIEEDLIEEVARVHGYDAVPVKAPSGVIAKAAEPEGRVAVADVRRALVNRGYSEAIEFSFVSDALLAKWQLDGGAVRLANPLSGDLAVMRTSLLPGLVEALKRNAARQQHRVRLFEIGAAFAAAGDAPRQTTRVAGVAMGPAYAEQWSLPHRALDFFDLKGDVEQMLAHAGAPSQSGGRDHSQNLDRPWSEFGFQPIGAAYLHPGRSAEIRRGAIHIGVVGSLHPRLLRALGLDAEVHVFELNLDAATVKTLPRARELSRFPAIRRDIAVVVEASVPAARMEVAVRAAVGAPLRDLILFDQFVGKGLPENTRSIAMGLILQDDYRTLTDEDADRSVDAAVAALGAQFGARLRG